MKKLFFLLIAVFFAVYLPAQTIVAFHEDFELPSLGDSLQNSSDPVGGVPWSITTNLQSSGFRADSNRAQIGITVYLTTNSFTTVGYSNISLQFSQICKLFFSDGGQLEVSVDGGTIWSPIGINEYLGSGNLITSGGISKFSESAYPEWLSGDTITKPSNTWWKTEIFNISSFAANQANVKIRFKYTGSSNPLAAGRYGWLLDDIKVLAANNELIVPRISFKAPVLKDTLYVTGPFTVQAYVKDSSSLGGVNLIYNVNSGSDITIPMTNISDSTFIADIPSYAYNTVINYKVIAVDTFNNSSTIPNSGYQTFVIKKGLPNVQIGNTTTSGLLSPVYIAAATNTNLYSYNVALFEKNEILSGGVIESLAFSKADAQGYTLGNATLRIYIKNTPATFVPSTYVSYLSEKNGAIKVYESTTQNLNTAIGWQTFNFNTGSLFSYNGSENLMVFVEWYRPGNATGAVNWHYNTATGKSSIFYGPNAIPATTNTTGQRANIKINFQSSNASQDATVLNFGSPTQIMTANTSVPVTARVKNLGTSLLTKANVHWMVDGVYKGVINWTGSLQQDFVGLPVSLGNINVAVGPHLLRAWTELPNDSIDQTPSNDTTTFNIFACQNLNGAYTVGSPTSNFPTFNDVFNALNNCGITGPVTFKIDSGTYQQQLIIPLINNVSATNTVTFESASGNNNDVVFQYTSTGTADNFVLRLDASKYIKVKNITFKALDATYGRVAELANGASYNTIEGCRLEMPVTTTSTVAGIYTASTIEQYNTFKNNTILNGYYGIYNYGTSATVLEKGNVIEGNTVTGFYYYGIYSYYQDSITINSNIVENGLNSAIVYGIQAGYNDNLVSISKNKVNVRSTGTSTTYAMYVYYCDNTASQPGKISNNFVSQSGSTGTVYGLTNYYSTYQNYYFNSVNIATGTSTYGAFYATGGSNVDLYNNNFVNTGGGYAYYIGTVAAIANSNYNNLYTSGTNLAYWSAAKTTLAALKAASGKDANSINLNPDYVSVSDLHVTNFALYGTGTPISAVTDDIDGNVRATPPCIGADEFIVPQVDAGLVLINNPNPMITLLNQDIKVTIKNFGLLPLTSAAINWSVNGIMQTPYSWTGNLTTNSKDTVIIGNNTFNLGQNTLKVYSELPNNQPDIFNLNDTLTRSIYACSGPLIGTYTIGGSGATYPTINAAILGLKNCGVSGPTIFNINPGTYNEQFIIPKITGSSAVNTITFKSATNDSTSVVFDITSGAVGNYVVKFDSAQYVKFSRLTMKNEITTGRVVEITGLSRYCEISNCVLSSNTGTTSSTASVIYSYNTKDEYIKILNNRILGGYYGIYLYGVGSAAGSKELGNVVQGNIIKDYYYYGTYLYYQDSLKVIGNLIQNHSTAGIVYALYSGYTDNAQYLKNNIQVSGTSTAYCMYLYYNNNTSGNGVAANNFISQTVSTAGVYGLYSYTSSNMNYYNNSVNVTKGSTSGYAFYITGGANCNLLNNIFSNTGGGYAYYASTTTAIITSNYNNLYATGTNLAYWSAAKTSLAALQLASGKDANSISVNPVFFSATDLHSENVGLFAKGTTTSLVTDDIDGQLRASIPCIGADEFVVMPNDARVKAMYTMGKLPIQAGSPHIVKTIIKNMGSNTLTNLNITLNITGNNSFTNIKTIDTLYSGVEDTIDFDAFIPSTLGLNTVKVSVPADDLIANNVINYKQYVTDSIFGYADDTSAITTYLGFNTGSGLFVSKYHVNGSRVIKSARIFITNSNTVGQVVYAVVLNNNGVIVDTSAYKTITASDANSWVTFNFLNQSATTTTNNNFYIGIAQTVGTGGYYPLGCQAETPTRRGAFYYTTSMNGGTLTETTQYGRFMIEAYVGLPAAKDATVSQILSPVSGCGLTNETVKINILNIGTDTIFGGQNVLTAHYGIKSNGNIVNSVSQIVNDTIFPSQIKEFTFSSPANMAVTTSDSNFHIIAWVDLTNDQLHNNDTLQKTVVSKYTPLNPVVTSPVNINFGSSITLNAVSNDTIYWYANITDTISFKRGAAFTTPILYDTTTYWVKASTTVGSNANLALTAVASHSGGGASPNYGPELYNNNIIPPSGTTGTGIWGWTNSNGWIEFTWNSPVSFNKVIFYKDARPMSTCTFQYWNGSAYVDFYNYNNSITDDSVTFPSITTTKLRFNNIAGSSNPSFREIQVFESMLIGCQSSAVPVVVNVAPGSDATITQILTPNTGCGLSNQTVEVRIKNKGNLPITGSQNALTAHYGLKLNGNIINVVNQQVPNTIIPGDSLDFSFNTPLTLAANGADSNYTIVAWNTLVNDLFINNDTTFKAVKSKYTPLSPVVANQVIPYGSTALFTTVSNDSIYWFANINDSLPIASGNQFTTPHLYDTTTFYVLAGQSGNGNPQFVGPANTSIGSGGTIGATSYVLLFDVMSPNGVTIKNVDVYPATSGSAFTMVIKNSSDVIIQTYNGVTTTTGTVQTVNVNFQVPVGNGYKLGFTSGPSFYRNTAGAVYPYTIPNVIEITGNTFDPAYYYNAYNWEVSTGSGTSGGCSSPRVPVIASVSSIPALDLSATQISEPVGAVVTGASTPVKVILTNYGSSTINSATIKWSVNGVAQPNVAWPGTLTNGQSSSPIYLGDFTFAGGPSVIKAWTYNPNGSTDMFPANDSAVANVLGCFTGNFTIGVSGTFPSFNTALTALNTAGLCGNVIFDVLPGTYNEALTINQIANSGPNTTITFRSQNGVNTSVILTSAVGSSVIKLNAADFIRFEKMTIRATSAVATTVELSGGADNNIFDGNIIELQSSSATTNKVINSTSTAMDNYNQFINNSITGGYYGIYWYGSSTNKKKGNQFKNNTITDFFYYGMYMYYNDSVTITGNALSNASNSATVYGLYSYYINSSIIAKNKIIITGTGTAYCMYIYYNNSTGGGSSLIANNFVSQSVGTAVYGIYNSSSNNINYYHNSVNITGGTASYYAFYSTGGSNNNVVNNIFSNTGGGYAYYVSTIAGINTSNYNDFYSSGTNLAYWTSAHTSLSSLQTTSGKDLNSLSVHPNFFSTSDLHIMLFELNGKATSIASINDDIDGDIRNITNPDMGADEFSLPANDAGISTIIDPFSPAATGLQNVKVIIRNFGASNLTSANIQWSVNGILQTSYPWSANLVSGDTNSLVIGNYNFTTGFNVIKVWTNLPNGLIDGYNANDTSVLNLTVCNGPLSGNYTIGGVSANFQTINSAVQSLFYCGINGPVVFNINQGIYNEQVNINAIPGSSAVNTVTFKSANNDSNSVVISFAPTSATANYVVKLNGVQYIKFKYLSIVNNTLNNQGRVVELANSANYNEFSNNVIQSIPSTSSTSAGIYSYNTKDEWNTIANNLITGGYYGIYLYGIGSAVGSLELGNSISNNIVKDFYYYGIYSYYQDSITINSNTIENGPNSGAVYGIYAAYNDNLLSISKNKVSVHGSGSSANYGIYVYYCDNTVTQPGIISNNFVSQSGTTGSTYGIDNYYSTYQKYLYNSVNITSGSATGGAFYSTNGSNIDLYNNIFCNTGIGYAYYIGTVGAIVNSNYNNIYATGTSLGYWGSAVSSLSALQTASGKDTNSISFDPDYLSITNLHVYTSAMNNIGIALTEVTDDFDGQTRSTSTPDIGADEYAPLPIDLGVTAIIEPVTHYSQVGGNIQIKCIVKNFGADSIANFNVVYKAGNATPVVETYTNYLHANQKDTVIFATQMPVVAGSFEIQVYTSLTSDGNYNNDTLKINYFGVSFKSVPYTENFDNTVEEWFTIDPNSQWEKGIPTGSVINTAHSAPNVWANRLNGNYSNANSSVLYSPIFNNAVFKADTLKFWHWIDAENDFDGGFIEYKTSSGWVLLGSITADTNATNWYNGATQNMWTGSGSGWQQSKYKISNLTNLGNTVQFRFVFNSDANTNNFNGWAIDDFELTLAPIPEDAGVTAITSPGLTSVVGETATVTVTVKNFGTSSLTDIPVKYQVGTAAIVTDTIAGPVAPGTSVNFTFNQTLQVANANYIICAYTSVAGDIYLQNNSTCKNVNIIPAANDVGISEILEPGSAVPPGTTNIKVVIKNYGTTTQTSVPVSYQRNALTPVNALWTGTLTAGATVEFTFPNPMNVPIGNSFSLCAFTNFTNDAYVHNDTVCKSVLLGIDDIEGSNFWLGQNMPNPTTGITNIEYSLPVAGEVKFDIMNLFGQKVYSIHEKADAGKHIIDINANNLSAGIYYYTIEFKGKRLVKKMIVNK